MKEVTDATTGFIIFFSIFWSIYIIVGYSFFRETYTMLKEKDEKDPRLCAAHLKGYRNSGIHYVLGGLASALGWPFIILIILFCNGTRHPRERQIYRDPKTHKRYILLEDSSSDSDSW